MPHEQHGDALFTVDDEAIVLTGRIDRIDVHQQTGERIILPLSDDGKSVAGLLGATCRDWFRDLTFDGLSKSSQMTTRTELSDGAQMQVVGDLTLSHAP